MTNHGIDGDISDGISVISDCDSINGRHSPMPPQKLSYKSCLDEIDHSPAATDTTKISLTSRVEDVNQSTNSHTLVERSGENGMEMFNSNDDVQRHTSWNPTNILLFGLIVGTAAILSSRCWGINSSYESMMPEMSALSQRIQDLERENLALKVEVSRLVDLHHAGHDHSHRNEKADETRPVKVKKVWTGDDESVIRIPKYPAKENHCNDEFIESDDLFATYNAKKCESRDDLKEQNDQRTKAKDTFKGEQSKGSDSGFQQFEPRKKKNVTKDDSTSKKRQKFAESNGKNVDSDNSKPISDKDEIVHNEKFVKFQEERQKLYDEAKQKYIERQRKFEEKQDKDKKHRDNAFKDQTNNPRKPSKDTDSEWYEKMMKQREELRAMGSDADAIKQQNKENWYLKRANEREKVRGKYEKQSKPKPYR